MIDEAPAVRRAHVHLVNPRYDAIGDRPCVPSLDDLDEPVDLVLLGVGDGALIEQLAAAAAASAPVGAVRVRLRARCGAARRGARRSRRAPGMAMCGAGCMGFVNNADGLRALGYLEPDPACPRAAISAGDALGIGVLRAAAQPGAARLRAGGVVRSGAGHRHRRLPRLRLDETDPRWSRWCSRRCARRRGCAAQLQRAADQDIPVGRAAGRRITVGAALVAAHSGALAGSRTRLGGVLRRDRRRAGERPRRARPTRSSCSPSAGGPGAGAASPPCTTRAPNERWSPTWRTSSACRSRRCRRPTLAALDGPARRRVWSPANPLDLWGTGADTRDAVRRVPARDGGRPGGRRHRAGRRPGRASTTATPSYPRRACSTCAADYRCAAGGARQRCLGGGPR